MKRFSETKILKTPRQLPLMPDMLDSLTIEIHMDYETRKQIEYQLGSLIEQARQVYRQLASYPSLTEAADLRAKHITIVNDINELKHQLSVAKEKKTDAKRRLHI